MVNWNLKLWAAVIALIILLTASGTWMSSQNSSSSDGSLSVSIVARVNNEGSGIFVKESVVADGPLYDSATDTYYSERWNGLVFMTPGPSSIQHMILMDIVKNDLGFTFAQYGTPASGNVVYWTAVAPGQMVSKLLESADIDGGIAWEPHYSAAIYTAGIVSVMSSAEVWANHPCCVITASNHYLAANGDTMLRFMSAYVKGVNWLNEAKSSTSANHAKLIQYVKDNTTVTDDTTIVSALNNVEYSYSIGELKSQIVTMVNTYSSLGLLTNSLKSIGFNSAQDYAAALVKTNYVQNSLKYVDGSYVPREPGDYPSLTPATIRVAYLQSDVHQLALHIAVSEGFFAQYGINISLVGPYNAGGDVMNAILADHADIGFVGSPPTVLTSINSAKVA
jgi:ABC-type nitrate/sulfonate/bicarbonate transport system substrate-binding protein